jgi:hypothetical protein
MNLGVPKMRAFLDKWKTAYKLLKKESASWSLSSESIHDRKERKTDRQKNLIEGGHWP